jgi:hypothetical protein
VCAQELLFQGNNAVHHMKMHQRMEFPALKIFAAVVSLISIYQLNFILTQLPEIRYQLEVVEVSARSAAAYTIEVDEKWKNYLLMKSVPSCKFLINYIKNLVMIAIKY